MNTNLSKIQNKQRWILEKENIFSFAEATHKYLMQVIHNSEDNLNEYNQLIQNNKQINELLL